LGVVLPRSLSAAPVLLHGHAAKQALCPLARFVGHAAVAGVIAVAVVFTQPLDVIVALIVPAILRGFREIIEDLPAVVLAVVVIVLFADAPKQSARAAAAGRAP
jgi:hypothetical protein